MSKWDELKKAAEYAQDFDHFADEAEEMRALSQFYDEVDPEQVLALIAENERLQRTLDLLKNPLPIFSISIKCMACGEYHEGLGNLPCPKMRPMSSMGEDQNNV